VSGSVSTSVFSFGLSVTCSVISHPCWGSFRFVVCGESIVRQLCYCILLIELLLNTFCVIKSSVYFKIRICAHEQRSAKWAFRKRAFQIGKYLCIEGQSVFLSPCVYNIINIIHVTTRKNHLHTTPRTDSQ